MRGNADLHTSMTKGMKEICDRYNNVMIENDIRKKKEAEAC